MPYFSSSSIRAGMPAGGGVFGGFWFTLAVGIALLGSAPEALAQPASELTQEERIREAVRHSDIGRLHFDGEEYEEAATRFRTAWELYPAIVVGFNAGRSYEFSGDYQNALEMYQATVDFAATQEQVSDGDAATVGRCRDGVTRLNNLLRSFEATLEAQPVTLSVDSNPPGAEVLINEVEYGVTPIDVELNPGVYGVFVELEGFESIEEDVELEPGRSQRLNYTLLRSSIDTRDPNWLAVGLAGGSGAMLIGLGALAALNAENEYNTATTIETMRDERAFENTVASGQDAQRTSNFLYGLGFAAVTAAVILYFMTDTSDAESEGESAAGDSPGPLWGIGPTRDGAAGSMTLSF